MGTPFLGCELSLWRLKLLCLGEDFQAILYRMHVAKSGRDQRANDPSKWNRTRQSNFSRATTKGNELEIFEEPFSWYEPLAGGILG